MPRISSFYGIAVYMYYRDHAPPRFHAIYGDHEAVFDIVSGDVREGRLPRRATTLVQDWLAIHRIELLHDWELASLEQPLLTIDPLD